MPEYTATEQTTIKSLRAAGNSFQAIADALGRPSGSAVRAKFEAMQRRTDRARMQAAKRRRPCMTCGTVFASEGVHNRMCDPCRTGAAGLSPLELAADCVACVAPDSGVVGDRSVNLVWGVSLRDTFTKGRAE